MHPALILGGFAGLAYLALRDNGKPATSPLSDWKPAPDASKANPFPDGNMPSNLVIPVPPPAPNNAPPTGVLAAPGVLDSSPGAVWRLSFDPSMAAPGKQTAVMFESTGTDETGGADAMPVVWVSPDGKQAAIMWVQHPAYGMKEFTAGKMYWAYNNYPTSSYPDQVVAAARAANV